MTDHIPADKLREIYDMYRNGDCTLHDAFRDAVALIPPKPLPTLADMTPEEREKCQWMQCEVYGLLTGVIVHVGGEKAVILWRSGMRTKSEFSRVTPRPDLDGLAWPAPTAETPPAKTADNPSPEVSADLPKSTPGQVVAKDICNNEEESLPRPEDVPAGEAWRVKVLGEEVNALKTNHPHHPWSVSSKPAFEGRNAYSNAGVALISRLVPETPRKTLVTVEDYQDAPVGTIVRARESSPYEKQVDGKWFMTGWNSGRIAEQMAGGTRTVIWEP